MDVDYEVVPAVFTAEDAIKPGAPAVHDANPDNICFVHLEGDKAATDAAIASAPHVVKHRFVINRVMAATMEPRGSVGVYDKASDRYTIYTTLQRALDFREKLSETLNVPESKVRVVAGDIGGSFGMKSGVYNEVGLVLLASKIIGRPVKWTATRTESFLADAAGRDNVTEAELALDKDGKFLALRIKTLCNLGAYVQPGSDGGPVSNLGTLAGVYTTPAIHVDVTATFSNTHWMRPYRGNGRPEAAYVIERMVDIAADRLGFDPVELRRKNLIPPSALPYKTALSFTYDSGEFEECMDICLKMADWKGFEKRRAEARKRGKLRGIGISNSIEKAGAAGYEGAEIRFDRTGSVTILSGAVSHGQGHETIFKQLVCDKLGLDPKDVHYEQGDTDVVFFGEGTGGSRTSSIGGGAMLMATDKIVDKAKKIAAHAMKVDDVELAGRRLRQPPDEPVAHDEGSRAARRQSEQASEGHGAGPQRQRGLLSAQGELSVGHAHLRTGNRRGDRRGRNPQLQRCRRCWRGDEPAAAEGADPRRHRHGHRPDADGRPEVRRQRRSAVGVLHGLRHAPRRQHELLRGEEPFVPDAVESAGREGRGRGRLRRRPPAVGNALVDALSHLGVDDVPMPATPLVLWRIINERKMNTAAE